MRFDLIANAPLAVQIHLFTVLPAFLLGTWLIFASRKGSPLHRVIGASYMALMVVTATAAIFIRSFGGGFSLIHLFVPLTFASVVWALIAIRRGWVKAHRGAMIGLYVGGLLIAGALAFTPGRIMHGLVFG